MPLYRAYPLEYRTSATAPPFEAWSGSGGYIARRGKLGNIGTRTAPIIAEQEPTYGLKTVGELLNVTGFAHDWLPARRPSAADPALASLVEDAVPFAPASPDFFKAVSYLVLLDTHFITTRSNTFTIYTTVMNRDPDKLEQSVYSQKTVDRTNLMPVVLYQGTDQLVPPTEFAVNGNRLRYGNISAIQQQRGEPRVIVERRTGYFDTRNDR